MTVEEIKIEIHFALLELYKYEGDLIANRTDERTIAAHLACYLKPHFSEWRVDTEYNRDGIETKEDTQGNPIFPDIIIHHRTPQRELRYSPENNLIALEVKGYWNKKDRAIDRRKLIDIKKRFGYQYIFRIELDKNRGEIIEECS